MFATYLMLVYMPYATHDLVFLSLPDGWTQATSVIYFPTRF